MNRDHIRAGDADRDEVVASLQRHYQAGRLTLEELEERTRRAMAARTLGELAALMTDLPAEPAPRLEPAEAAPSCRWRRREGLPLSRQAATYGTTMLMLVAIWALSGRGYFWPVWPMLGWGAALAMRAFGGPARQAQALPQPYGRRWRDRAGRP